MIQIQRNELLQQQLVRLEAQLARETEQARRRERERILLSLLRCWNANPSRTLEELRELGGAPLDGSFIVLQLVSPPPSQEQPPDTRELREAQRLARRVVQRLAPPEIQLLHTRDADAYYCVINTQDRARDLTAEAEGYAAAILRALEKNCFLSMQVNISIPVDALRDVSRAYRSLEQIQDYRTFLLDETPCLTYSRIQDRFTDLGGCQAPEKHLIYAVRTHNFEDARACLREFFQVLFVENRPGVASLASQFYRLVNPLLDTVSEMLADVSIDSPEWRALSGCQENLLRVESLEDLKRRAGETLDALEDVYLKKLSGAEPRWMYQLQTLIEQNYQDPQISVSALADAVNITAVHMSRVFRQFRGLGVMDCIHHLRIDMAKELLSQGESVKAVSVQVGYTSPLTMTRAFKKYDGQTPGNYIPSHAASVRSG